MSAAGLFAVGVVVTLIVGASMTLLILGAILDGREERDRKAREQDAPSGEVAVPVPRGGKLP
jgi:hypothetical protein